MRLARLQNWDVAASPLEHTLRLQLKFVYGYASFPQEISYDLHLLLHRPELDMHDNDLQIFPASKPRASAKSRKKLPSDYNGKLFCSRFTHASLSWVACCSLAC